MKASTFLFWKRVSFLYKLTFLRQKNVSPYVLMFFFADFLGLMGLISQNPNKQRSFKQTQIRPKQTQNQNGSDLGLIL